MRYQVTVSRHHPVLGLRPTHEYVEEADNLGDAMDSVRTLLDGLSSYALHVATITCAAGCQHHLHTFGSYEDTENGVRGRSGRGGCRER